MLSDYLLRGLFPLRFVEDDLWKAANPPIKPPPPEENYDPWDGNDDDGSGSEEWSWQAMIQYMRPFLLGFSIFFAGTVMICADWHMYFSVTTNHSAFLFAAGIVFFIVGGVIMTFNFASPSFITAILERQIKISKILRRKKISKYNPLQ